MPHRRSAKTGSFDAHFDELMKHFPRKAAPQPRTLGNRELIEKRDIHAQLFERAWKLTSED